LGGSQSYTVKKKNVSFTRRFEEGTDQAQPQELEEGIVLVPSKEGRELLIPKQLFSGPQSIEDVSIV
jgi:hypothetical protein